MSMHTTQLSSKILTSQVVLIGRSGAGKSTLLAGIARLLPPAAGQLFVGGSEARDVPLSRWRGALACIPQVPSNLWSADGSTHTESNKLYRKVKHRYRPNRSLYRGISEIWFREAFPRCGSLRFRISQI